MINSPSIPRQQSARVVEKPLHVPAVLPEPTIIEKPIAAELRVKGTLGVVTATLRRTGVPMSVREIVEQGGAELPTRSKTPMTVVARDLAMDIKKKGEASAYVRTAPGRFTLRELWAPHPVVTYS